jgi:large subunit ribosomal protein L5
MNRLKKQYTDKYKGELQKELKLNSSMEVPRLEKIIVNCGVGEAASNAQALEDVMEILTLVTGQRPVATKAKKAIAAFKIRQGDTIGAMVTLRGNRMWDFFDKLVNLVLPRTKDFRGLSPKSFDGSGNYSFGIEDHIVFLEVDPNKVQKIRSLQITLVISGDNDENSKAFLNKFGFPFSKDGN